MTSTDGTNGAASASHHHGGGLKLIVGFVPWLVAFFVTGAGAVRVGMVLAAIVSVALVGADLARGTKPKLLDSSTVAAMVLFALLSFVVDDDFLGQWLNSLLTGALLVIMGGSIVVGHPFTLAYARESAPRDVWGTPGFVHVNTVITAVWTGAVAFMTVGAVIAGAQMEGDPSLADAIGFGSTAIGLAFAFWFTAHYPDHYAARSAGAT